MRTTTALALGALAVLAGPPPSSAAEAQHPAAAIRLSFKLEPRLAGGTYGGERWVSPPTYTGVSAQDTVEAMARAVDASGRSTQVGVEWKPSDPEMVMVSPARGERVRITVRRPGESAIALTSGAASKRLVVRATRVNGAWRVSISQ